MPRSTGPLPSPSPPWCCLVRCEIRLALPSLPSARWQPSSSTPELLLPPLRRSIPPAIPHWRPGMRSSFEPRTRSATLPSSSGRTPRASRGSRHLATAPRGTRTPTGRSSRTSPARFRQSIAAREQFLREVPPECDTESQGLDYAFYAGDRYFAHGHFEEARRLLRPLYEQHCTTSQLGNATWRDLIVMSNMERDDAQSRRLAVAEKRHPCAGPLPEVHSEPWPEVILNVAFDDAAKVLVMAENALQDRNGAPAAQGREHVRICCSLGACAQGCAAGRPARSSIDLQLGEVNRAIHLSPLFFHLVYGADSPRIVGAWRDHPNTGPNIVQPPNPPSTRRASSC